MSTYFSFFFLVWIILASWTIFSLRGIFRFDHWPVSRQRVFAVLTLPPLVAVMLGYAGGSLAFSSSKPVDYYYSPSGCCYTTSVPLEFHRISWDGQVPEQTSDWGERHTLQATALVRGGKIKVYNPFQVPQTSSPEFAALQISRAIEAVYGRKIGYRELQQRYLETGEDGKVKLKSTGFTLLQDYPGLTGPSDYQSLITLLLVALPWLAFSGVTFLTIRPSFSELGRRIVIVGMFVPMTVLGVGSIAAHATGVVDLPALGRWWAALIRQTGESYPIAPFSAWLIGAILILAAYLVAQKAFQRVEIQPEPDQTRLDWEPWSLRWN